MHSRRIAVFAGLCVIVGGGCAELNGPARAGQPLELFVPGLDLGRGEAVSGGNRGSLGPSAVGPTAGQISTASSDPDAIPPEYYTPVWMQYQTNPSVSSGYVGLDAVLNYKGNYGLIDMSLSGIDGSGQAASAFPVYKEERTAEPGALNTVPASTSMSFDTQSCGGSISYVVNFKAANVYPLPDGGEEFVERAEASEARKLAQSVCETKEERYPDDGGSGEDGSSPPPGDGGGGGSTDEREVHTVCWVLITYYSDGTETRQLLGCDTW